MRIVVFGATGNMGRRVIAEALYRGHEVTGVARNSEGLNKLPASVDAQIGNAKNIDDVIKLSTGQDVVINSMRPSPGSESEIEQTTKTLMDGLAITGVRLLVSGGAANLIVPGTHGKKVIEDPRYLPVAARDVAQASMQQYNIYLSETRVDWTYFSPAANLVPGKRTGIFRLGTNELIVDREGASTISMEDLAVAIVDEAQHAEHHQTRITAGY
jgi:putative NADH-flavin reductase